MLISIPEFIGHLHPVLVHLPIGILLLACLFLWQSRKDKYENLQKPINVILLCGMISAICSCITGYVLSQTGDYDDTLVGWHQWMGISVALVSILTYYFRRKKALRKWQWALATLLLLLIFITGHLGGSLTHGTDYLTGPLKTLSEDSAEKLFTRKPLPNVQQALAYTDVVEPVLHRTCYSCHGPTRQKGKLRLDRPDLILKGGKDGTVIRPGNSRESELVKRILLPREDEHHMAPKEKPQLDHHQVMLLRWWIDNGADFTKRVKDLPQPDSIKPLLLALQREEVFRQIDFGIPSEPVESAAQAALDTLKKLGVVVMPVAQGSNYLRADFVTAETSRDTALTLLMPIKKQLVWLNLRNTAVGDSAMAAVGQCIRIRKLQLDHTTISDGGLRYLAKLDGLENLTLTDTRITAAGMKWLKGLKKLKSVYLYHTQIDRKDWARLVQEFPHTRLDSGGYTIPFLQTDTMVVKPPKKK